mmetsp:Transcript_36330/g.50470  ORF Transcript_36330/g.50470 Transcript_36330/m.50470 type:complete len:260 (+) Transcript_36330:1510-2289(+)
MALHAAPQRLRHHVLHLGWLDDYILGVLPCQQDLGARAVRLLFGAVRNLQRDVLVAHGSLHCRDAVLEAAPRHVRAEVDCNAVQQVLAQRPLLRVVCGNEERPAGVPDRETLSLNYVDSFCQHIEKQVGDSVVQQVDLVYIQNATMALRQQAWLEDCLAGLHGLLNVHSPQQPVLRHTQRDLHKVRLAHISLDLPLAHEVCEAVLPLLRQLWVSVAIRSTHALDGRHELMQSPCHDGLGCAPPAADADAPHGRVHRSQQ